MPPPILFLTHAEYGQANIVLATPTTIAKTSAYRIHIASFAELRDRVDSINSNISSTTSKLTFQALPGKSMKKTIQQHFPGGADAIVLPPSLPNAVRCMRIWMAVPFGADAREYLQDYHTIQKLIREIRPVAVAIDPLFMQAHDAARGLGLNYVTLDPISAQMTIGHFTCEDFLSYPLAGFGSEYPLTFIDKLRIYLFVLAIVTLPWFGSRQLSGILRARKAAGIRHLRPAIPSYRSEDLYICPHVPETNFPAKMVLPANVIGIPPIAASQSSFEPEDLLWHWLQQYPAVLINFGSSDATTDPNDIAAIVEGIGYLLQALSEVQVLWKVKHDWTRSSPDTQTDVRRLVASGRFRVTEWLTVDPSVLLASGRIACSVHHGGANSFYEACRARYLGFGLIGNAGTAPRVDTAQFKTKLLQVMRDEGIKNKAAEIGRVCREMGDGKEIAAKAIVEWAEANNAASTSASDAPKKSDSRSRRAPEAGNI